MTDAREQKGLIIAATSKLTQKGATWLVPSQQNTGKKYVVVPHATQPHCSCPDHETTGQPCKHIHAVSFAIKREENEDGSVTETRTLILTEKRITYPQQWAAYNRAQTNEKATFQVMLRDLCAGLPDREPGNGRPFLRTADAVFSAVFKVYSTLSARRFMTDLKDAHEKGYISKLPCHNSVLGVLESEEMFPILKALVERSAAPLKPLETNFACGSSGFSGCRYDRWIEEKYGSPMRKTLRAWVKAHIMCGTKTNAITAVEIHDQHAADVVQLPDLLATTAQRFTVKEVGRLGLLVAPELGGHRLDWCCAAYPVQVQRFPSQRRSVGEVLPVLLTTAGRVSEAVSSTQQRGIDLQHDQAEVW